MENKCYSYIQDMLLVLTAVKYRSSFLIKIYWEWNEISNYCNIWYTRPAHNKKNSI